jgi:hypothetical protein
VLTCRWPRISFLDQGDSDWRKNIYIHTHIHMSVYVYMYIYMCVCAFIYIYIWIFHYIHLINRVGGFKHVLFSISFMVCNPSHWLSYFSRWWKPPTRNVKKYARILKELMIAYMRPGKMRVPPSAKMSDATCIPHNQLAEGSPTPMLNWTVSKVRCWHAASMNAWSWASRFVLGHASTRV